MNDVAQSSRSANISIPDLMRNVNRKIYNGNLNPNLRRRVFAVKAIKSQIVQILADLRGKGLFEVKG